MGNIFWYISVLYINATIFIILLLGILNEVHNYLPPFKYNFLKEYAIINICFVRVYDDTL